VLDVGADEALAVAIDRAGLDVLICGAYPGAGLRRYELARAREAVREGIPRERVLVQISPGQPAPAGWLSLVDVDAGMPASTREAIARAGAIATVSALLGASVIATRHVREIRRCLDMTESIRGTRPPAWAVRGLG
jgi:dihydropteroate synthase